MTTADRIALLDRLMDGLMARYRVRVPDVDRVCAALVDEGAIAAPGDIENDHIAFRSLGVPHLGIASLEKAFLHLGYTRRDKYEFAEKKLDAYWYAPPENRFPRIFISELRVGDLSPEAQRIVRSYTDEVTADPTDGLNLDDPEAIDAFLHRPLWRTPTWADYQALAAESEYASWTIFNRYYLYHYTVSVHNLPAGYATLADFNAFLLRRGFKLNNSGGLMKISPDGLLLQSSTVAEVGPATFADGDVHEISGSYVEFAERRALPQFAHLPAAELRREHRRDGFEAANADRIFESTYDAQTKRAG
jgi:hypothetical protein